MKPGKKRSKPIMRSTPVLQTEALLLAERGPEAWELIHGEAAQAMAVEKSDEKVEGA